MAGDIVELFRHLGGDVAEVVQGTPDDAARHREAVAWRLARGGDGRRRVDDLALLTPPGTATGP